MNRPFLIFLTLLSLTTLLVTWLAPAFLPVTFQWLTPFWRWLLTGLIILPLAGILGIRYYRKRKRHFFTPYKDSEEKQILKQDALQRKRKLNGDWQQLWRKLQQRNGPNPYALPWLMMLGTDGSGKTAWLVDAGFERINGNASNQRSGIIFWLGEQAVIIELAGHYYTRAKELLAESLWQDLITLLKKKRPRRPLTAVLGALSTDQLVMRQPSGLLELARQLRWRLMELNRQFGMQFPAWFLLTQADRLNGFSEFFRNCNQQRQVMPWGFSLPEGYRRDHFQQAFNQCHQELCASLPDCLQHEKDANARQAQMRYTLQFTLLGERLRFFCEEIFQSQQGIPSPELKGIWFSSCGQYGTSINLLASELARQHGFTVLLEQPQAQDTQSYFNQQFFSRIIMNNLGGVGENPAARKLWLIRTSLAYGGLLVILAGGLGILWNQIKYNETLLNQQKKITREFRDSASQLGKKPVLTDAIDPLKQLRDINELYQQSSRWHHHLGLLDNKTTDKVHQAYQKQLQKYFWCPLSGLLHKNLQTAQTNHSETLFDDLQYYLMLFRPELRDTEALNNHIQFVISQRQELDSEQLGKLHLLLQDLWRITTSPVHPDQALIEEASNALAGQIDEKVIYDHIKTLPKYRGTLSMEELFGADFNALFILNTDDYDREFPVFFTRNQYKTLDLSPASSLLRQEISNLNRIRKGTDSVSLVEMTRISSRVRQLYFQEYIRAWQDLLSRVQLRENKGTQQLSRQMSRLFKGDGAFLYEMMDVVASETTLAEPRGQNPASIATEASTLTRSSSVQKTAALLRKADRLIPGKTVSADNPEVVNIAFSEYANYSANHRSVLDQIIENLLQEMQDLYQFYDHSHALYSQASSIMQKQRSILMDIWEQGAKDSTIAGRWLTQLANHMWWLTINGAGEYCQNRWQQDVYKFWEQYLNNRFPMKADAHHDAQLNDFMDFFKPEGVLDNYIQNVLSPFLIPNQTGWQLKQVRGHFLPIDRKALRLLDETRKLRELLFTPDGSMQINYRMRIRELTPEVTEFSIRDASGRFSYRHGPQLWEDRKWPNHEGEQLTVSMNNNGVILSQKNYSGSWAWLRFAFDCRQWQNGSLIELDFNHKGYNAQLELTTPRRGNPFNRELYGKIQIPAKILR